MYVRINTFKSRTFPVLVVLAIILLILSGLSLGTGAIHLSFKEILMVFGSKLGLVENIDETNKLVLMNIRLPRLILTIFVGGALGLSGASLQGLFRNPLVEPGIIGVSSGSAMGAIIVILFIGNFIPMLSEFSSQYLLPVFSFFGGLIATYLTLALSKYEGKTQVTYLILAGVAINSLAGAVIGLSIFYADDTQLRSFTFWTLGDLSVATWDKLLIIIPLLSIAFFGLIKLGNSLNVISLGESEAYHSGVSVERVKIAVVILATLAVGTTVAFTGIIGFVGLVVPHIIRISLTADHRLVLPASMFGGACLLVIADVFARVLVEPAELPIGVITAIVGAPFFLYLLINSKRKRLL